MESETRVEWREWGQAAFDEARDRDCPVLLSLTTTWCADCHEMDAETYAEPRVAANVTDRFVPVRVDADRHPRIRERYTMGGFPSTVFLTPEGKLLTGATALRPDAMRDVLEKVADTWASADDPGRVPRALSGDLPPSAPVTDAVEEHLAGQLGDKYDAEYAGWGSGAKFPMARTVEFAFKRERDQALRTLDAVRDHLFDDADRGDGDPVGGFFRFAGQRDWGDVHHAKLLDTNAALVRAFANAYVHTGDDAYRDPAAATVRYLTDDLWSGVAVGGSQGPGDGADRFAADAPDREGRVRTDLTAYAGPNALAADAFLTFHGYTDDERAREYGERVLSSLERDLIRDDGTVVRFDETGETGPEDVLEDAARVVAAFTRAGQVLGEGVDVAARVADHAIDALHEGGSFRDGPAAGAGMLDRPLRPLDANAEMADALVDLATLTGEDRYREVAAETVGAFAGAADRVGVQVAVYGTAAARVARDPLTVAVGDAAGSDLHRAALRVADHEKVVVPDAGDRFDVEPGTARVVGVDGVATDPDELLGLVGER